MAKLEKIGIAPNLLLKDVENTAPFLYKGEIKTDGPSRSYLAKLVAHRKNLKALQTIDLTEYFHICMAAHWTTAGTFVPTNVDNQIRESLWKHPAAGKHMDRMAQITLDAWSWDYSQVTNRKSYNPTTGQVMSTHEGTWLSVAIGAYNALVRAQKKVLAEEMAAAILAEADKEEKLLRELRERRDHVNFLRSTALMAHNFGDLDRVIDQWEMAPDSFKDRIYKLGHQLNAAWSPMLVFAGQVNKAFLSVENHRHMSMRQPRCLRRSQNFLIPVGPFMNEWGQALGTAPDLSTADKAEIVVALFEGYKRQNLALGYTRAYHGMMSVLPEGLHSLESELPYDLVDELRKSVFIKTAELSEEEFLSRIKQRLEEFVCPVTSWRF